MRRTRTPRSRPSPKRCTCELTVTERHRGRDRHAAVFIYRQAVHTSHSSAGSSRVGPRHGQGCRGARVGPAMRAAGGMRVSRVGLQPQPLMDRGSRQVRPRRMVPARVQAYVSDPARHPGRASQGDAGARRALQLPDLHGHLHAREHGLEEAGSRYRVGSLLAGACGGVRRPLQVRGRFVAVL